MSFNTRTIHLLEVTIVLQFCLSVLHVGNNQPQSQVLQYKGLRQTPVPPSRRLRAPRFCQK